MKIISTRFDRRPTTVINGSRPSRQITLGREKGAMAGRVGSVSTSCSTYQYADVTRWSTLTFSANSVVILLLCSRLEFLFCFFFSIRLPPIRVRWPAGRVHQPRLRPPLSKFYYTHIFPPLERTLCVTPPAPAPPLPSPPPAPTATVPTAVVIKMIYAL